MNPVRSAAFAEEYPIYPISAVSGEGVEKLLQDVMNLLETTAPKQVYYEQEFFPEDIVAVSDLPYTITESVERDGKRSFIVEGPKIEKMLSFTNLDTEKGFVYFQQFLVRSKILDELRRQGIEDGDTVRMYGHAFDFYGDDLEDLEEEEETNADE